MNREIKTRMISLSILILFIAMGSIQGVMAQQKGWRPVEPDDLKTTSPVVDKGADAEAIFWEVYVDDSSAFEMALNHYVRIKIFTEKGREDFAKRDILFTRGMRIKDVEARVTKPDGTVSVLKKDDVIEREVIRASGLRIKAKTFALPGLEVGSVIEYKYRETTDDAAANLRLIFQRDIPIRTISYFVKPFSGRNAMRYIRFNVGNTSFEKDKNGYSRATMDNLPAVPDEPYMPPEDEIRSWIYIYYTSDTSRNPSEYWKRISGLVFESARESLKPNDDIKRATEQVIRGADSDMAKIRAIYQFVKSEIRNLSYASDVSDSERKRGRDHKGAADVFKHKMAFASGVDMLFGAMARAAGFDARVALSGDRESMAFNPDIANMSLSLNSSCIAIRVGNEWKFFSPASYLTPFGMLTWNEEGQSALISDNKSLIWEELPLTPPEASTEKRTGTFSLDENGALTGTAKIEFTGHAAFQRRRALFRSNDQEIEDAVRSLIRSYMLGDAQVSSIKVENVKDPELPLVYSFEVKAPDFASRAGRRLFFHPNVFEKGSKPRFTSENRVTPISFRYPFSKKDSFTIKLPSGFSLDNADSPAPLADADRISEQKILMVIDEGANKLTYDRTFVFGNRGYIGFPAQAYPVLKRLFETYNAGEVHQLALLREQ
jgi:hypothetical protein